MKRSFTPFVNSLAIAGAVILFAAAAVFTQESTPWSQNTSPLPAPTGHVNDYAGVIDAATKQQLETKLRELKNTTDPAVEIAVAVVNTTGDRAIFDYSLAVARGWGIGSKADDNPSALLFIAIDDRKYFTQVSKDLEDELPDGVVGALQRQYLVPEFKKQNYSKGIADTIDAYIAAIRNKGNVSVPQATPAAGPSVSEGGSIFGAICCGAIILIVLLTIFGRGGRGPTGRDRKRWGGGAFGANGAGDVAASALPWVIGSILSGGGSSGSSSSSDWGGSSGGDWGGFGGGGDFGGGGAGGDW